MPIVLGYHGCDQHTARRLLSGSVFEPSDKAYDWLGSGSYFWEGDPQRAYEWALERRPIRPCLVGAIVELGNCLDLTTRRGVETVKRAHARYVGLQVISGNPVPVNEAPRRGPSRDLVLRYLDRAVIDHIHATNRRLSQKTNGAIREFDTVRALFPEGEPIYTGAGFWEKTHIQIAVRNPACIRGVFRVPDNELEDLAIPNPYR